MNHLLLLGPEIGLSLLALSLMLWESFSPRNKTIWFGLTSTALIAAIAYYSVFFIRGELLFVSGAGLSPFRIQNLQIQYEPIYQMLSVDSMSVFFKIALLGAVLLVVWMSKDYYEFTDAPMGTYLSMILLATVGMMIMVSSIDLLMALIGLELLGITSFVMTGYIFHRRSSAEAAIKFFLVGTLSSAILLFGISYYYGYFGTTSFAPLIEFVINQQSPDIVLMLLMGFIIAGLGFKLAIVPFHMWAPDAYEGAPTPVTAFLSVAPKAAAIGLILRLFSNHAALQLTTMLGIIAALTMTVGNVGAIHQTNIKRLLAYSSIAQVGYILVAFVAGGILGIQAAMVYTFVYLFMNLGVFAVLVLVANSSKSEELSTFSGLYKRSFPLALILVVFLLSMTGIPPLAGFVGKFAIFAAVIKQQGLLWLGVVAVINSVVSLYYYFKIVHQMFFTDESTNLGLKFSPTLVSCVTLSLLITVSVGLFPNALLSWVRNLLGS